MLEIAAALEPPFELIGELIKKAGREDSSGERRYLAARLGVRDFAAVVTSLRITIHQAEELRQVFVDAFGECDEVDAR